MLGTNPSPKPPSAPPQGDHDETEVSKPGGRLLDDGARVYPKSGRRKHDLEVVIPTDLKLSWLHKFMKDFGVATGFAIMNMFFYVWMIGGLKSEMKEGREVQVAADNRRSDEHKELLKEVRAISDALNAKQISDQEAAMHALKAELEALKNRDREPAPQPTVNVSPGGNVTIGNPPAPAPSPIRRKK